MAPNNSSGFDTTNNGVIALINASGALTETLEQFDFGHWQLRQFSNGVDLMNKWEKEQIDVRAVIVQGEVMDTFGIAMVQTLRAKSFPDVPFVLIATNVTANILQLALSAGIADVYKPVSYTHLTLPTNREV